MGVGELPLTGEDGAALAPVPLRKRAGRPSGAMNRKTKALADYLTGLGYTDPAIVLAETYSRPVDELADALGCDKLEAFQLQQRAAAELMPYLHGKMPLEVKVTEQRLPLLIMDLGTNQLEQAALGHGPQALSIGRLIEDAETLENEQISTGDAGASHDDASHDDGKLL